MSNEFENAMKVLREKANVAAYDGQASMRVPLSMLLGILGRAEEWPELTRLRAALTECLNEFRQRASGSSPVVHRGAFEMMELCEKALGVKK